MASKHALVCVGAGVGNVIFSVPPAKILSELGYVVDCFADAAEAHLLGIVAGLPCFRHTYAAHHPRQCYDVILYTAARMRSAGTWNGWLKPGGVSLASLDPEKHLNIHEVEMNCAPLRELGWKDDLPLPQVNARPITAGNHVVLLPDCKSEPAWGIKRWTDAKWIALSKRIRDAGLVPVALSDDAKSTAWAQEGRALDMGGHTPIWEAAGIIAGARAAVGIDNGLSHVAAAVRTPLIVLWGPASWTKNEPLGLGVVARIGPTSTCAPCQFGRWASWPGAVNCARPAPCMEQTVREVFDALRELLEWQEQRADVNRPDYSTWPFFYRGANADEEWLYDNRHLMHGRIIDVGTPRGIRPFLGGCGTVEVLDLLPTVTKFEYTSPVDIQADITDLSGVLTDGSVDTMIATNILEHVTDPQAAVNELHRVLQPGGHLFLLTPFCYPWHMDPDYWRFTEQGIQLLAERAGLTIVSIETTHPARKELDAYFTALWEGKGDLKRAAGIGLSVRCILRKA